MDLTVYFGLLPEPEAQGEGFGIAFEWDIPLLDGYRWKQLTNARQQPSLDGFRSSSTPHVGREMCDEQGLPNVSIITGWHALPMLQALAACRRRHIPCLVRGESNALRKRGLRARLCHRILLSQFKAFLTIGSSNRDFYASYGVPESRMFPAPYFIENKRFQDQLQHALPKRNDLRKEWGIPEKAACFVFTGKLQPKKRPLDLLHALATLVNVEPSCQLPTANCQTPIHLLVVGTGELLEEAKAFAAEHHLPVTFVGFLNQSEITNAYAAADCMVLPSDTGETWGLVVNEAMACGLPALVSDQVGCRQDLIVENETGWSFPCGDIDGLASKLTEIAALPQDTLKTLGKNARNHIADYSPEAAAKGTLAAIAAVSRVKGEKVVGRDRRLPAR